jgi:hypothetical protein
MKRNHRRSQAPSGGAPSRRGRAAPAGEDALGQAAAAFQRAGFTDATLVLRWREIAGAEIARIAEPVKLTEGPDGGVLTLKCEPGATVFLQHQTRELLHRLAAYFGPRITRVRLVPGELEPRSEPPEHPAARAPDLGAQPASPTLSQAIERLEQRRGIVKGKPRR